MRHDVRFANDYTSAPSNKREVSSKTFSYFHAECLRFSFGLIDLPLFLRCLYMRHIFHFIWSSVALADD